MQDKKFKPQAKPFKSNKISSVYRVTDQKNQKYYAKFFVEKKMHELHIFQSSEFNQSILNDLSDQIYPQHFLEIKYTYSMPDGFIFVTDPYENNLDQYLKNKVMTENQALEIFQQIVKGVYSLVMAGYWHRNIRPEHFVKVGSLWKMESLEAEGIESQYLWNPAYQPPQAYIKSRFSDMELDEMIVWSLGSLLLDLLLSSHKLKDQYIIAKYKNEPFSFKAIGVKKQFSQKITNLLAKMLHYNPEKRMKLKQLFANEFVSRTVANQFKKGIQKKARIYLSGQSQLSHSLSQSQERAQERLTVKQFTKEKQEIDNNLRISLNPKNNQKLDSQEDMMKTILKVTQNQNNRYSLGTISEEDNSISSSRAQQLDHFFQNNQLSMAVEAYKCCFDKSELLIISTSKLDRVKYSENVQQAILLNKYALTFVSLMNLSQLAESMNRNANFFKLDGELWSAFQSSIEFKGFKQIINHRRNERRNLLTPLKEYIFKLKDSKRSLMKDPNIEQFIHKDYRNTKFEDIKQPYRKIVKHSYDIVTKEFNTYKTQQLARLGMYMTYCLTVDKLYIKEQIPINFQHYFKWTKIDNSQYVPLDQFQNYLDNADKKTLVSHSIYILKKYFHV